MLAAARVKAIQGTDYSAPEQAVASPKHFSRPTASPRAARDYNTTDLSEQRLPESLPTAVQGRDRRRRGHGHVAFNALNGVPACGNDYLMNHILKGEWDFDGFVEGDWTAVAELRALPAEDTRRRRVRARGGRRRPRRGAGAPTPAWILRLTSTLIRDFGEQLLAQGRISMQRINDAVRRILRVKFRADLFENPYAPVAPDNAEAEMLETDAVAAARKAASRSMVLLRTTVGSCRWIPRRRRRR